mmetsp:Transcript_85169/g.237722  ORF Transcript_85169/g.237722 Transcript_85169/m.237722 type:complete len:384 (-) Transcript_85169:210-1361(-)
MQNTQWSSVAFTALLLLWMNGHVRQKLSGGVGSAWMRISQTAHTDSGPFSPNLVVWAIDRHAVGQMRLVESLTGLLEAHEGVQNPTPLAYAVVLVDGANLTCDALASEGMQTPCREVSLEPGTGPKCDLPKRRTFNKNVLHLVQLPLELWLPTFENTLDELSKLIFEGQPRNNGSFKRPELVSNRANHIRFLADAIFLPHGISQVLYLDADTCPVAPVHDLFRTPGDSAVVAAYKLDKDGEEILVDNDKEHVNRELAFVRDSGFEFSFNAGVVLLRTETMCRYGLMDKVLATQRHHNLVHKLWGQGTNQPPFEIASAQSLTMVDFVWNCRVMMESEAKQLKRLRWGQFSRCRIFHPSTRGTSVDERSCKAFLRFKGESAWFRR